MKYHSMRPCRIARLRKKERVLESNRRLRCCVKNNNKTSFEKVKMIKKTNEKEIEKVNYSNHLRMSWTNMRNTRKIGIIVRRVPISEAIFVLEKRVDRHRD